MISTHPTHTIRLRGPWHYNVAARSTMQADGTIAEQTTDLPPDGKIDIPSDWGPTLGKEFRGRVIYCRRFGQPTGLQANDAVDLVLDRVDCFGRAWLNKTLIGDIPPGGAAARFDIRPLLLPRNELIVEVCFPVVPAGQPPLDRPGREHLPGGLVGEVRLEIFAPRG